MLSNIVEYQPTLLDIFIFCPILSVIIKTRLISIESQPKKIVVEVVVVIGVGVFVVHGVVVVIPVVDPKNLSINYG